MAENVNTNPRYDHEMLTLALALPFINLRSDDELRSEFLSEKEALTEKHGNNNFFNSPVAGVIPVCKRMSPNFDFKF